MARAARTPTTPTTIVRLDAETSGAKELNFPPDIAAASRQVVENEISLFRRRQANLNEQLSILAQQQRQKEIELSELRSRQPSVARERQISEERLLSFKNLSAVGAASNNDRLEAEHLVRCDVLMAIVRELFEAGLDVRPFGANALEPTGRSCACGGDRLEALPSGDLRQHAFQTLGFLKLVHGSTLPFLNFAFEISTSFKRLAAPLEPANPRAPAHVSQCPSTSPRSIAPLMETIDTPSFAA